MIFETQQYQQDCINNIITLLKDFDFDTHDTASLKKCFEHFYSHTPQPIQTLSNRRNIDILMETGTGKTFTYLNTIFLSYTKNIIKTNSSFLCLEKLS
ncbi:hypothetical protein BBW65_02465 [Helicobacter enhydrae]|uniref:Helicase/UvrB N-terminal domain-containing protein n=1 Tax=Helicobacter enhydrae TaxID=222136 RepID=A0A1B1U4M4_9HELI|nr:hypothetical protein BBW65_02465 [Helicobacter enhydrae]